jgi:hypothetical protein
MDARTRIAHLKRTLAQAIWTIALVMLLQYFIGLSASIATNVGPDRT